MTWYLKRTRQCAKCPWKKSTNPFDIPRGYSVERHKNLKVTIADDLSYDKPIKVMSCHEHDQDEQVMCIGWLYNQIGPGNNIGLRLKMLSCTNRNEWEIDGEQHDSFEETLPDET